MKVTMFFSQIATISKLLQNNTKTGRGGQSAQKGHTMKDGRNRIIFHRGYNILKSKYGTFRLLPYNVITVAGLKRAADDYGYSFMYDSHPEFNTLEECTDYIDKIYPEETT